MAEVKRTLHFVSVSDGMEVDQIHLFDDGTVGGGNYADGTAEGVIRSRVMFEEETRTEAFAFLAKYGWSNGNSMIRLGDLDGATPAEG
jgi:hypothetical protein